MNKPLMQCKPVDRRFSKGVTGPHTYRPSEAAENAGSRIAIQLTMNNPERCHAIIDSFFAGDDLSEQPSEQEILNTPLVSIISVRTANALEEIGVYTLGQVLQETDKRLLTIANFGEMALAEVKAAAVKLLGSGGIGIRSKSWDQPKLR
jgi:DNA-directed RNA polymerase alpha subunit